MKLAWRAHGALLALAVLASCGARHEVVSSKGAECLARAMYFESDRSSRDGMIAVGTVVMNRVAAEEFPASVCAVVGQTGQFAPGVMSKDRGEGAALALARQSADAVLSGERHQDVGGAKFFHALWYKAHYNNMHYTASAGGNAFYEKRKPALVTQPTPLPNREGVTGGATVAAMNAPEQRSFLARLWAGDRLPSIVLKSCDNGLEYG